MARADRLRDAQGMAALLQSPAVLVASPACLDDHPDAIVCCATIAADELPILANNLVSRCDGPCGSWIQYRPDVAAARRKLCVTCANALLRAMAGPTGPVSDG